MAKSLSPDRLQTMRNIVFVGLMGAGKTTVGKRLAKRHGLPFLDTDHEIERRCGASIPTIFDLEGEDGFRRREAKVLADAMALSGHVITTGGGAVILEENRAVMRTGFVIYLDADPEQLWQRLKADTSRPLLQKSADPRDTLASLYGVRDPLYRSVADLIVPTTRASVSVVMRAIEDGLRQAGVLVT
jgi:shikimate kinase